MKNNSVNIVLALLVIFVPDIGRSWGMERDRLSIGSYAPPVALVVVDAKGKRAGVDLTKPVSLNGLGEEVSEIEGSSVDQQNIGSDIPNTPSSKPTAWNITINDRGDQIYIAEVNGLGTGVCKVRVSAGRPREIMVKPFTTSFLIAGNQKKKLRVEYYPSKDFSVKVVRIVEGFDLIKSVEVACALGLIKTTGMCKSLTAKANTINKSLKRGNTRSAKGEVKAFINELTYSAGRRNVLEPAYAILIDEAEMLSK